MNTGNMIRYMAFAACTDKILNSDLPALSITRSHNLLKFQVRDPEVSCYFYGRCNYELPLCVLQLARRSAHENSTGRENPVPGEKEVPNRTKIRFSHRKDIAERGGAGVSRRRLKPEVHW